MEIINKLNVEVKSGKEKVGVGFMNQGTMFQDSDNKVFFDKYNPVYFDFLGYEFDGPLYHDVTEVGRKRKEKTKSKGKTKEKGKFGMGGIALGVATGGISMVAGVGRKKTKGASNANSKTIENEMSNSITKQVEVPSTAILNFKDSNNVKFSIMIVCDSVLELNLRNFVALEEITEKELVDNSKTVVEQLKEFKELLDLGIITQEEFDKKKNELLN